MEKSTVYLSAAQKASLARTAQAEGRSEATLIRAGIDIVTARHRTGEAVVRYEPAPVAGDRPGPASPGRPRWVSREVFVRDIAGQQADPGLRAELHSLAPDTTDDV
ncbi:MAG: hypothetical protein ACYDAN_03365 [Candidatus Limnocylindrales bacterium]